MPAALMWSTLPDPPVIATVAPSKVVVVWKPWSRHVPTRQASPTGGGLGAGLGLAVGVARSTADPWGLAVRPEVAGGALAAWWLADPPGATTRKPASAASAATTGTATASCPRRVRHQTGAPGLVAGPGAAAGQGPPGGAVTGGGAAGGVHSPPPGGRAIVIVSGRAAPGSWPATSCPSAFSAAASWPAAFSAA